MKNKILVGSLFVLLGVLILQSHSDGRANRDRDNTGAPGGQMGGNGMSITCQNCHENGTFEVGLDLELLDADDQVVTEYIPNEVYTAKVRIATLSGDSPSGYGFQMVSLVDSDNSDINGWTDAEHSDNVQLVLANSTGRVYAEHNNISTTNEFTAQWTAPAEDSGDISFYIAGIGANGNGASSGDHAPTPIRLTFAESKSTNTISLDPEIELSIFPNPTAEFLNITGEIENKTIEIYKGDTFLKSVKANDEKLILPIDELKNGLYFILVKNRDNQIIATKSIVKS